METEMIVFWVVVLSRFFVPLLIPRYPLPAILAALIIDAVDQTIFQKTGLDIDLRTYQGYDKALDIYYLTIAYLSIMRNWTNLFAIKMARFLWYFRLIGVTIYEFNPNGYLLLLMPNVFEYFFIWYELFRLRWNPAKFSKRLIIGATAFIWIFIKLPQEYWIHIAHMDTTDFIKEQIFGLSTDATLAEMWTAKPEVFLITGLVIIGLAIIAYFGFKKLPPADWRFSLRSHTHPEEKIEIAEVPVKPKKLDLWNWDVAEKIVLISLVTIIFSQVLPDVKATPIELGIAVFVIVFVNAIVSQLLFKSGFINMRSFVQFMVMLTINTGVALVYLILTTSADSSINFANTVFFLLLLTLIVTLFDRYRPFYEERIKNSP